RAVIERDLPRRFGRAALVHRYEVASEGTGEVLARGTLVLASGPSDAAPAAASPVAPAAPAPAAGAKQSLRTALIALLPPAVAAPLRRAWRRLRHGGSVPPVLRWTRRPDVLEVGAEGVVEVEVTNPGTVPDDLRVEFEPPYGFGLDCAPAEPQRVR